MPNYEVEAKLVISDKRARKSIARIHRSLGALIKQIDRVNSKASRMGAIMAKAQSRVGGRSARRGGGVGPGGAGGGAYVAAGASIALIVAGTRALWNQVTAASEFRKEMEMGQLGLATMYNLIDKTPLDAAMQRANSQMIKFNTMAAEAPGSGKDMMAIYSRLYGPMKRLGVATAQIEASVKGAAVMGKAFGIQDIGALGRDVEEMLTGRAGRRTTKIFAIANAWGLLNIEAKEFNALSADKRLKIVNDLIAKFAPLGTRMAKTWDGASEAFGGWVGIIRDFAASGLFTDLGRQLYEFNQLIERNLPAIKGYMDIASGKGAKVIQSTATMGGAFAKTTSMTPLVAGEAGIGGGLVAGALAFAFFASKMLAIFGATGPMATAFMGFMSLPFVVVAAVVVAGIAALISIFQVFNDRAETLGKFFSTVLGGVVGMVVHILSSAFWGLIAVMRSLFTILLFALVPLFDSMFRIFVVLAAAVLVVVEIFRILAETIYQFFQLFSGRNVSVMADSLQTLMENFQFFIGNLVEGFGNLFGSIMDMIANALSPFDTTKTNPIVEAFRDMAAIARFQGQAAKVRVMGIDFSMKGLEEKEIGGQVKQFQGAPQITIHRQIINQEFKGKADPDRVIATFKEEFVKQATAPISSIADIPLRA